MDKNLENEVNAQLDRGKASKRAREAAALILEKGSCTTTDLENYGYKHAPRVIRDLREAGVEILTTPERYFDPGNEKPKTRARYTIVGVDPNRKSRRPIPKRVSNAVKSSGRCEACGSSINLQVDHRVPFEIGGETIPHVVDELMPLCGSCNRSKSWTCENCPNWETKDPNICKSCYWASPDFYDHISTKLEKMIQISIDDPEIIKYINEKNPNIVDIVCNYIHCQVDYKKGQRN